MLLAQQKPTHYYQLPSTGGASARLIQPGKDKLDRLSRSKFEEPASSDAAPFGI